MKLMIILFGVWGSLASAEMDVHGQKALKETQELMTDKAKRQETISKDPRQTATDQNIRGLLNGDDKMTEEVYALAAEVFGNVANSSGGDVKKMQEMMARFQRDPAAFAASWTPEQKAKLKALAEKMKKPEMTPRQ